MAQLPTKAPTTATVSVGGVDTPRRALARLFIALSLLLLLLSSYGPLLDHHFAEKIPNHTHAYLAQANPEHAHPFEGPHVHSASGPGYGPDLPSILQPGALEETVFLTAYEGVAPSLFALLNTSRPMLMAFSQPPTHPHRFALSSNEVAPAPQLIAPPKRPPRG